VQQLEKKKQETSKRKYLGDIILIVTKKAKRIKKCVELKI
jgi:hypothetical protein